ncbi:MAG: hypothetical protein AAFU67_02750, partial [Bacteroidota bacterium]
DLYIFEGSGDDMEMLVGDDSDGTLSTVEFKPGASKEYSLYINAEAFSGDEVVGHYGLVITHDLPDSGGSKPSPTPSPTPSNGDETFVFESTIKSIGRLGRNDDFDIISTDMISSKFLMTEDQKMFHLINDETEVYDIIEFESDGNKHTLDVKDSNRDRYVLILDLDEDLILIMEKDRGDRGIFFIYNIENSYKQ